MTRTKTIDWMPLSISVPRELYERIERRRGDVKRSTYVARILKEALE